MRMSDAVLLERASLEQIARIFGCSVAQVRAQFRTNARRLGRMAEQARGGMVAGFTREQLLSMQTDMARRAKE